MGSELVGSGSSVDEEMHSIPRLLLEIEKNPGLIHSDKRKAVVRAYSALWSPKATESPNRRAIDSSPH